MFLSMLYGAHVGVILNIPAKAASTGSGQWTRLQRERAGFAAWLCEPDPLLELIAGVKHQATAGE